MTEIGREFSGDTRFPSGTCGIQGVPAPVAHSADGLPYDFVLYERIAA